MIAGVTGKVRRAAHLLFICGLLGAGGAPSLLATGVTLAWDPSTDPAVAGYHLYYGAVSRTYTNMVQAATATSAVVSNLVPGITYYFAATTYTISGLESDYSTEATYATPALSVSNQPPTLDPLAGLTISANAGLQTVNLTGISSGSTSTISIGAGSSNPGLIPTPTINYTSPNATGTLTFAPVPNASGSALITVTVNNGAAGNNTFSQSFTVTVTSATQAPTLDPIADLTLGENAGQQTVDLTGISWGVTNGTPAPSAFSSNPALIPNPQVAYSFPASTGTLTFVPAPNSFGSATVTVMVDNGAAASNTLIRSFNITVNPYPPPMLDPLNNLTLAGDAGAQTINLTGIASGVANQPSTLTVTATSSNPALVPNPTVAYTSPNATGTLTLMPATNLAGSATITVTVDDGHAPNNAVMRTFAVTVNSVGASNTPSAWTLWWQSAAGGLGAWQMDGSNATTQATIATVNPAWNLVGVGDFNGDTNADLVWQSTSGWVGLWLMNGTNIASQSILNSTPVLSDWHLVGAGHFHDNHDTDLLWQSASGWVGLWLMNGTNCATQMLVNSSPVTPGWEIVGTGDFNGDGSSDILWQSTGGWIGLWLMNGTNCTSRMVINAAPVSSGWRIAGTADVNGDGQTDILWQHDSGAIGYWLMNGTNCIQAGLFIPSKVDPAWKIAGPR